MSPITIAWSMCAAACGMLGLLHLLIWLSERRGSVYLLSAVMAFSAAASALIELALLQAQSLDVLVPLIVWQNLAVCSLVLSMVWFLYAYFGTARRWLAWTITLLWSAGLVVNFLSPASLTFAEITDLRRETTFWGEQFAIPVGPTNPWKLLPDLASLLVLGYVVDASVRLWRSGNRRRAAVIGGAIVVFILLAGIHTPLVDAGLVATPYMVSFAFVAIVLAMGYELVSDAVRAPRYAREIQANEERWRALMENVHLAVVGLDPDGRIDYVNPFLCNLLGYPRKELLGRPITALVPHTEIRALEQRLESAARSGPRPHSRWTLVCASGERRQLAWSSVQLRATDGEFAGILSVGADMTDQLEAQRDLQQMQRDMERLARVNLMGELAAALAHELNQPLTAILSNAQAARRFLAAATPDLAELREILEDIIRDDKRAGEVIHRLRAMLRKGEVARQRFDLNQALREVVGLIAGELGDQGVELREDYASDLPPVAGGRVEIQQVVMNLLLNALRAVRSVPQGRRQIQLGSSLNGREALVSVRDSGPGIHPDELSSIFDVFFTSKADGLGMGLAISRRIIEAHGARIWAENPEGGGARFAFALPLAPGGGERNDD